ncbi:hypothetical protein HK102_004230 [Quaeritorhiza haematococci]|nr:hypothetical protein HK102_004230 [Quaeritorhiza haematococci]
MKNLEALPWYEHQAPSMHLYGRYGHPTPSVTAFQNDRALVLQDPASDTNNIRIKRKNGEQVALWFRFDCSIPAINLDNIKGLDKTKVDINSETGRLVLPMVDSSSVRTVADQWRGQGEMLLLVNPEFFSTPGAGAAWRRIVSWEVDEGRNALVLNTVSASLKDYASEFELHAINSIGQEGADATTTTSNPSESGASFRRRLQRRQFGKIKDAIQSTAGKVGDAAGNAADKVGTAADKATDKVVEGTKDAAGAVVNGTEKVVDKIVDEALDKDISFSFKDNNRTSLNLPNFKLRIACADCEGNGKGKLRVSAKGLLSDPEVRLEFEGEMAIKMGFDIFVTQPLNIFSRNISVFEVPIGGVSIPNVVSVGPVFKVEMNAELAVISSMTASTGFDFIIPPFKTSISNVKKAKDQLGNAQVTQERFNPQFTARPLKFKGAVTSLQARLAVSPQIQMGISIANNDIGAGIAFENAVIARATLSGKGLIDLLKEAKLPEKPVEATIEKQESKDPQSGDPGLANAPPPPPPSPGQKCGDKPKITVDVLSVLAATVGPIRHVLATPLNKNLFEACAA